MLLGSSLLFVLAIKQYEILDSRQAHSVAVKLDVNH